MDFSLTQVVYVLASSLEGEVSEYTEDLFLQPGYTESAETSMSHPYPACILQINTLNSVKTSSHNQEGQPPATSVERAQAIGSIHLILSLGLT